MFSMAVNLYLCPLCVFSFFFFHSVFSLFLPSHSPPNPYFLPLSSILVSDNRINAVARSQSTINPFLSFFPSSSSNQLYLICVPLLVLSIWPYKYNESLEEKYGMLKLSSVDKVYPRLMNVEKWKTTILLQRTQRGERRIDGKSLGNKKLRNKSDHLFRDSRNIEDKKKNKLLLSWLGSE